MRLVKYCLWIILVVAVVFLTLNNLHSAPVNLFPLPYTLEVPLILIIYASILFGAVTGAAIAAFGFIPTHYALKIQTAENNKLRAKLMEYETPKEADQADSKSPIISP